MSTQPLPQLNELRCCSFNMHGLLNGLPMLQTLCDNHEIILLQEHWLHSHELFRLSELFSDFNSYGISAMNDKLAAGILVGRPYGGVAIMWKKKLNFSMKVIAYDESGRYLAVMLNSDKKSFIIHCVYFPCYSSNVEYIVEVTNLISKIELNLVNFPSAYHIIAGDFNFECRVDIKSFDLLKNMLDRCNIFSCDSCNSSSLSLTYSIIMKVWSIGPELITFLLVVI